MFLKFAKIIKTFSKRERLIFFSALAAFFVSLIFIFISVFGQKTKEIPVYGGDFSEGVVGQPSYVNPVLAVSNSTDDDLSSVIFDSISSMAESIKASDDGKNWSIRLKEGVKWQDGELITSDDVIFTIQSIQDPDSRSALFSNFQGVIPERVSEREIKLTLSNPYSFFDATLIRLRPIPKHIFESVPVSNFRLSDYNLEPIGSGPYKFASYKKEKNGFISEYYLVRNNDYYDKKPYLDKITFKFYESNEKAIKAFNRGLIDGLAGLEPKDAKSIVVGFNDLEFRLPRYYAVFMNSNSNVALTEKPVRDALNMATDKDKIIADVFHGNAIAINGPIVPGMNGYSSEINGFGFSLDQAAETLEQAGWKIGSDGVREKITTAGNTKLEFSLTVPETGFLKDTANILKDDFSKIGAKLNISLVSNQAMSEFLKTRNYQLLIFGNAFFGGVSDLFSYWHSSEKTYPGLNLSAYENSSVDSLVEAIRKDFNEDKRNSDIFAAERIIVNDSPAIFLYSPNYFYAVKEKLRGVDQGIISSASDRFSNIGNWYIKTARVIAN